MRRSTATLRVPKIRCEGCAATIEKALAALPGVSATRVAVTAKEVEVDFDADRLDEARVASTLAEAGFPPVVVSGPSEAARAAP
jgi:copper chaperone CopZ